MFRSVICGLLLLILAVSAGAQEISVPLDSTGKIFVIDGDLERRLGLFDDYPGFIEARLYQANESEYFLEVLHVKDSVTVRSRVPQTSEQVISIRQRVTDAISLRAPDALYDHKGRGGLLVNSAILSMGYYSWAVPVATNAEGPGAVASFFFLGSAGIMIPYFITEHSNISVSTAMMDFYGGSRGIAHGIALYYALDPQRDSDRAPYGWGVVGSIAERFAFNQWARTTNMSEGKAAVIGAVGDFGTGLSAILASGHDLWDVEHQSESGLIVLGGSALGVFAGSQLADHGDYSRGDAYVLRATGLLGAAVPATIADATRADGQLAANLATAGSAVGLGIGHAILKNRDFTRSQGLSIFILELAGAALATAVVITTEPNESTPYSIAATLGGIGGFALSYSMASRSARVLKKADSFDLELNPLPLFASLPEKSRSDHEHKAKLALSLSYRF